MVCHIKKKIAGQNNFNTIQGIGTENPYLQVDGYTFSGKYVAPIGSYLILEEKKPLGM